MIPETQSLDLSLYHIDTGLQSLVEYRQERVSDREQPATEEELAAVDAEIRRYLEALPQKVSGVCAVLRNWKAQRETADAERKRLAAIIEHLDTMERNLKGYLAEILERQPEPKKGCRKLTGADGSVLMLKGNGGLQPLVITDESMLPDDCRLVIATFRADAYERLWRYMVLPHVNAVPIAKDVKPNNDAIRAKLAEPCPECNGIEPMCPACGDTNTQAVPGAYLETRGKHVEVK